MKRIISLILVILMIFTLLPTNIASAVGDSGGGARVINLIPVVNGKLDASKYISEPMSGETMTVYFTELTDKFARDYVVSNTQHITLIMYTNKKF